VNNTRDCVKPLALAVFGPVPLDLAAFKGKRATAASKIVQAAFERAYPDHAWGRKEGCYVFALRNQSAPVPFYAGQANRSLCVESTNAENRLLYIDAAARHKGTPVLFFVAAASPTKNDLDKRLLKELEDELIRLTVRTNPKGVLNVHGALGKRKPYFVKGIADLSYTSKVGKADGAAKSFASMFFDMSA
jgi:hypothetical protein